MTAVAVDLQGAAAATAALADRADRLQQLAPALEQVADRLDEAALARFDAASVGRVLRPRTVLARARRWGYYRRAVGPAPRALRFTGALRASRGEAVPTHVRTVDPDGLTWGSRLERQRYFPEIRLTTAEIEALVQPPITAWLGGRTAAS